MPIVIPDTEDYTNGPIERPTTGDRGNEDVFEILEVFMERLATHSHSGADSAEINLNFSKEVQTFAIGTNLTWNPIAPNEGNYRTTLTTPVGPAKTFDELDRFFYFSRDGGTTYQRFYPVVDKIDDGSYYLYCNDNTVDIKVVTI